MIITHYDEDHVNGLLNLLESNIIITEIWLPEIFGRISKTLMQNENSILKQIFEYKNQSKEGFKEIIVNKSESNKVIDIIYYQIKVKTAIIKKVLKKLKTILPITFN